LAYTKEGITLEVEDNGSGFVTPNLPMTIAVDNVFPSTAVAAITPSTPVWNPSLSVPVTMTGTMSEAGGAGVASYQWQREEVPLNPGPACSALGLPVATYTNVGAPVNGLPDGTPPASLGLLTDTTVTNNKCYRYRVVATDRVGNFTFLANGNHVATDDIDPVATLNTLPASGSGTINVSGTALDSISTVANVTVRLEDLDAPIDPTVTIYTSGGPPTWNLKMSLSFRLVTAGPLAIWILGRYEFIVSTMNS
jgi:hypothetical protein